MPVRIFMGSAVEPGIAQRWVPPLQRRPALLDSNRPLRRQAEEAGRRGKV